VLDRADHGGALEAATLIGQMRSYISLLDVWSNEVERAENPKKAVLQMPPPGVSSSPGGQMLLREQDRLLPSANIANLVARELPSNAKVSKDSKLMIQQAVSEFICFVTSNANEMCLNGKRKSITADDIVESLEELDLGRLLLPLRSAVPMVTPPPRSRSDVSLARSNSVGGTGKMSKANSASSMSKSPSMAFIGGKPPLIAAPAFVAGKPPLVAGKPPLVARPVDYAAMLANAPPLPPGVKLTPFYFQPSVVQGTPEHKDKDSGFKRSQTMAWPVVMAPPQKTRKVADAVLMPAAAARSSVQ